MGMDHANVSWEATLIMYYGKVLESEWAGWEPNKYYWPESGVPLPPQGEDSCRLSRWPVQLSSRANCDGQFLNLSCLHCLLGDDVILLSSSECGLFIDTIFFLNWSHIVYIFLGEVYSIAIFSQHIPHIIIIQKHFVTCLGCCAY